MALLTVIWKLSKNYFLIVPWKNSIQIWNKLNKFPLVHGKTKEQFEIIISESKLQAPSGFTLHLLLLTLRFNYCHSAELLKLIHFPCMRNLEKFIQDSSTVSCQHHMNRNVNYYVVFQMLNVIK